MAAAGELDCRITFQVRPYSEAGDGAGNHEGEWTAQFTVWARRSFLRGGESVMAARLAGRQPGILKVRASSQTRQITPAWRAVSARDTTEIWNIRSVQPSEDRADIELLVERGVAT